jgi:hypothetical protein
VVNQFAVDLQALKRVRITFAKNASINFSDRPFESTVISALRPAGTFVLTAIHSARLIKEGTKFTALNAVRESSDFMPLPKRYFLDTFLLTPLVKTTRIQSVLRQGGHI